MDLNIDTIRSLDANKTYYLANSTGEIKEAGAWQKFKCFFGIGDALASAPRLPNLPPPNPRRHLAQASPAEKALEISSPCNLSTGCV